MNKCIGCITEKKQVLSGYSVKFCPRAFDEGNCRIFGAEDYSITLICDKVAFDTYEISKDYEISIETKPLEIKRTFPSSITF